MKDRTLTGKPSVDKPWLKFYPKEISMLQIQKSTINDYLKTSCASMDEVILHYYGRDMLWREFLDLVETTAKALKSLGVGVGSKLPVFLQTVPEFLIILLAAEKVGAHVICRDNLPHENAEAVRQSNSKIVFAHDFLSQENISAMRNVGVERFILISPYRYADRTQIPSYIEQEIHTLYSGSHNFGTGALHWDAFLALGKGFSGDYLAPVDVDRPLYSAYTSGSTGTSKQVIHSAHSMLGNIQQLALYGSADGYRPTWLVTILPPCLIAVVNSMLLCAIASRKLLIMDPFVNVHDLDLEIMRYRPNGWPAVPMFLEMLMQSKRIPADYDISHLFAVGTGAETLNNGQYRRGVKFLKQHKSDAMLTVGYGLSEAGSSCFFPCPAGSIEKGAIGMPIPLNTVSIFKPGTQEELSYNQMGEICIHTPAAMLGYDDPIKTAEVLQKHADGLTWIHSGDYGYIDENGVVYIYGRGNTERYGGGYLSEIFMENAVIDANIPGIVDAFFVLLPDAKHEKYFVPYLYVVLEEGYTVEDIRVQVDGVLQPHEIPHHIIQIAERPYWHFKTNRVGLTKKTMESRAARAMLDKRRAEAAGKTPAAVQPKAKPTPKRASTSKSNNYIPAEVAVIGSLLALMLGVIFLVCAVMTTAVVQIVLLTAAICMMLQSACILSVTAIILISRR